MMKKFGLPAAVALFVAAALLTSCDGFFTTSWAKDNARDPSKIVVTADNVWTLLENALGDSATSKGILDKIAELPANEIDNNLKEAAITAANQASGVDRALLTSLPELLDAIEGDDGDALEEILETLTDKVSGNDLPGIAEDLTTILGNVNDDSGTLVFADTEFLDNLGEMDIAVLAITLVLAEFENYGGDLETYMTYLTSKDLEHGSNLTASEKVIIALANAVIAKDGDMGDMLKEFLEL